LGHNGAGKTTLINILTGLYSSSSGSAFYNSYNILSSEGAEHFRKVLGICPQHDVLFNDLTVEEHLVMFCVFKSVDNSLISQEVLNVIKVFGLEEKRNTKVENLSGGQKRKLSIAIALVGGSSVIFLDEPTSGMDITSRRNLWNILKRNLNGKIIILTTHYMEEASILGNRIGILSEGNMKCIGSPLFLIEKLGKNINLNITKKPEAENNKIINFVNENIGNNINIENEIFNEEILFKIPKKNKNSNEYNWSSFFEKLDDQSEALNINNYSISMPTLEDVFINLSKIIKQNNAKDEEKEIHKKTEYNNKILYNENNYHAKYNTCEKVIRDLKISFKKRITQIYRDKKTFILEILCPILLALLGCLVGSINILEENKSFPLHLNQITNNSQIIFYSYEDEYLENNTFEDLFQKYSSEDLSKIIYKKIEIPIPSNDFEDNSVIIINKLYDAQKQIQEQNFVHYIISKIDKNNHYYEFNCFINIIARQSTPIYSNYLLNNLVRFATENKDLEIEMIMEPLPYSKEKINEMQDNNNIMILFFISLSFTLIPSNFITIIIKERENNSKHLQIISGISLFSYWFNNYLFELIKYYIIGGIFYY
jgi:ATP-binding cassette subfamily A (ABC1) protein 3